MTLSAQWKDTDEVEIDLSLRTRAVSAFAASLALPSLDDEGAGQLAEAEGLVTHLTSLVLVDEAGEAVKGLPGLRKVALESPAASMSLAGEVFERQVSFHRSGPGARPAFGVARPMRTGTESANPSSRRPSFLDSGSRGRMASMDASLSPKGPMLRRLASEIDWDGEPARLLAGDLTGLPAKTAELLTRFSDEMRNTALRLGLAPLDLAIGLLAHCASSEKRSASRIARALLGRCDLQLLDDVLGELGLPPYEGGRGISATID